MTTARDPRLVRLVPQGPGERRADHAARAWDGIRDSLAWRHQRLDRLCPAALDVEARRTAALHQHLLGSISPLAEAFGISPDHARQMLRGERNRPTLFESFLSVQKTAEPRSGLAASLAIPLREIDYQTTPADRRPVVLGSALVLVLETFGTALGVVERAREDGRIDESERPHVVASLEALQRRVAELLEAVRQAGERP